MSPRAVVHFTCSECRRRITDGVYTSRRGETLCYNCAEDDDLTICASCGRVVERIDSIETLDGTLWCDECASDLCFTCDNCNQSAWSGEQFVVQRIIGTGRGLQSRLGDSLCPDCGFALTAACVECGRPTYAYQSHGTACGGDVCQICYNRLYVRCIACGAAEYRSYARTVGNETYCAECDAEDEYFAPRGFCNSSGDVTEIRSARCFGIELETDECDNYTILRGSPAWGAKDDCTVAGKEFFSAILSGDEGLAAIRDWGEFARRYKWRAGESAGYHLHLDMRNESDDSLYAIAYAYRRTQEVWMSFVACHRHDNTYSHGIRWSCTDIAHAVRANSCYYDWACSGTRYNWCNLTAYRDHSTIEIRLYEGTCDDTEVINWVKAHTRFADWASKLGFAGVKQALTGLDNNGRFALIKTIWNDSDLSTYYSEMAKSHNHGYLTPGSNEEN